MKLAKTVLAGYENKSRGIWVLFFFVCMCIHV